MMNRNISWIGGVTLFASILGGIFSTYSFYSREYFSVELSVVVFVLISIYLQLMFHWKRLGFLVLILWVVYALPFIHVIPYIWFDYDSKPLILWGLAVNSYMTDKTIIELTAMLGAVGGMGILFGVTSSTFNRVHLKRRCAQQDAPRQISLSFIIFSIWIAVGFALSWFMSPESDIFTANYTSSTSPSDGKNFSSAWMVSYVILAYVYCDAILDPNQYMRSRKTLLILAVIAYIVVVFQLLRGDRESVPFVFGLILVSFYWADAYRKTLTSKLPVLKIALVVFLILVISMIVGALRSASVGVQDIGGLIEVLRNLYDAELIGFSNLLHGTWSAVLLTPLSVAGDYVYGLLEFKAGATYRDLIFSIPPGFVADAIGYTRPIDGLNGPAWDMRYGIGGTHAIVVPFINFGIVGVFVVPALWSYIFTTMEDRNMRNLSVVNLVFLCTIVMAAPHWLWYGEKSGINAVIIWMVMAFFYRISLRFSQYEKGFRVIDKVSPHPGAVT